MYNVDKYNVLLQFYNRIYKIYWKHLLLVNRIDPLIKDKETTIENRK